MGFLIFLFLLSLLPIGAQLNVRKAYNACRSFESSLRLKGAEHVRKQLDLATLANVHVKEISGHYQDYYNPKTQTIYLSCENFRGTHLGALAVSSHELGHAIQHKENKRLWRIHYTLLPFFPFASGFTWVSVLIALLMQSSFLACLSVLFLTLVICFQCITLPIEWNANVKAKRMLNSDGNIPPEEMLRINQLLQAAFWTYVTSPLLFVFVFLRPLVNLLRNN